MPLAIDLYCGLGGWTEGLLAEGYDVVGFDIESHVYGHHRYPAQLVLQDVRTLHGRQFRGADLIVASPPCQEFSYRAMPWKRAKAMPPPDVSLFDACFRIQLEACAASGRHIPLLVENVKGAQPWVGRARWHYGSYYLWGDVPALMPMTKSLLGDGRKTISPSWSRFKVTGEVSPHWNQTALSGTKFSATGDQWFDGKPRDKMLSDLGPAAFSSKSNKRKEASALIAKIPLPLSRHIARVYKPARSVTHVLSIPDP